jgi:hypothetical protein
VCRDALGNGHDAALHLVADRQLCRRLVVLAGNLDELCVRSITLSPLLVSPDRVLPSLISPEYHLNTRTRGSSSSLGSVALAHGRSGDPSGEYAVTTTPCCKRSHAAYLALGKVDEGLLGKVHMAFDLQHGGAVLGRVGNDVRELFMSVKCRGVENLAEK